MCLRSVFGPDNHGALAHRAQVLALLALVEHPEAIPADAALRLGQEILALVGAEPAVRRCEAVAPADPADASATKSLSEIIRCFDRAFAPSFEWTPSAGRQGHSD